MNCAEDGISSNKKIDTLGEYLRNLRLTTYNKGKKRFGFTQKELSRALKSLSDKQGLEGISVSPSYISTIEKGFIDVSIGVLLIFEIFFEIESGTLASIISKQIMSQQKKKVG